MNCTASVRIDLAALRHNLGEVRRRAPGARVMAVVKANAYGHGLSPAVQALGAADAFAVTSIDDALVVRETCELDRPVVLLQGVFSTEELAIALRHNIEVVVHSSEQLAMLEQRRSRKLAGVWLKIDTGMNRLGFRPENARAAWARLRETTMAHTPLGLMTHLASADKREDRYTAAQIRRFSQLTDKMIGVRSIANSAGILAWPKSHADWVRPGIMLYGATPLANRSGLAEGLEPVMTFATRLIAVKHVSKGEGVGYGATWTVPADSTLGVAAIGYGDGYPRHAENGTPVLVNGRRTRLVGRVSMGMITIDLSDHPDAKVGDPVVLWGEGLPAEEVARAADTIAYELFCGVTERVKVSFTGADEIPSRVSATSSDANAFRGSHPEGCATATSRTE